MWRETFQKRKRNEWNETERKKRNETNERGNLREGREAPPRRCLHPSFVSFRFFRSVSFHSFRFRFWKVSLRLCDFGHLISYCEIEADTQAKKRLKPKRNGGWDSSKIKADIQAKPRPALNHFLPLGGLWTGGSGTPSFGINYGSISFGQLSGYIVFCILLIGGGFAPKISTVQNTM